MTQADRDRLVALKKAKKRLITQREAAIELGLSVRQVKRLMHAMKKRGDQAVIHGLRGRPSTHKIDAEVQRKAIGVLSTEDYQGFGPTLASECLAKFHEIAVSRETLRQWMMGAGLWKAGQEKILKVHLWRPRRSRFGELVQWDTSDHDWLEGRGPRLYLIAMIDDATSRVMARFVDSDSREANMGVLELWLRRWGRMIGCYTDKASLFQTAVKTKRGEQREGKDREPMPPTQIGRALQELNIAWIAAHSPQAKGRIERFFETAQDRLVLLMRLAKVATMQQANEYLENEFLPWWEQNLTVEAANSDDAHRKLGKEHDLAAILSHVEEREVNNDYTVRLDNQLYGIVHADVCNGLRGATVRVEKRRDGTVAIRFRDRYLRHQLCEPAKRVSKPAAQARSRKGPNAGGKSKWMKNFLQTKGPSIGKAIAISNATS